MARDPGTGLGGRPTFEHNGPYIFNPMPHMFTFGFLQDDISEGGVSSDDQVKRLGFIVPKQSFEFAPYDQQWGFRFMYNPATIQISTGNSERVIPGPMEDFKPLFTSTQAIGFEIILNRIYDMSNYNDQDVVEYPGGISLTDRNGILTRGTDYDLEFLWRALNGGPFQDDGRKMKTADVGTSFMNIVQLQFAPNISYLGFVTNISATHERFNHRMIPTLTKVGITFTRMTSFDMDVATEDPTDLEDGWDEWGSGGGGGV